MLRARKEQKLETSHGTYVISTLSKAWKPKLHELKDQVSARSGCTEGWATALLMRSVCVHGCSRPNSSNLMQSR